MAYLTGFTQAFSGDTSEIDSSAQHTIGTWATDVNGNIYIYLKGVISTAAGSWVSYDEVHQTSLLVADALGRVGIAMAAIVADKFGWYQIYGKSTTALAISGGDCAADSGIWSTSTAGSVDDVKVAGDDIIGAVCRVQESDAIITAELSFPFCDNSDRVN